MNISSYNITEVTYHYIGLRALGGLPPGVSRQDQNTAISRSILKYVRDKALRLMLPEPRGTFDTVGEKICYELVHFEFARSGRSAFELTDAGRAVLTLLETRKYVELRRIMAMVHLSTYDNLRVMLQKHIKVGAIWRPIVDADQMGSFGYVQSLLDPMFKESAGEEAADVLAKSEARSPKKLEDDLHGRILLRTIPEVHFNVALFRALCDRLVSLRLLNTMRATIGKSEFVKTYSPCVTESPTRPWYVTLNIPLHSGESFTIYLCEPNMEDESTRNELQEAIYRSFQSLSPQAGYYSLPAVRDVVCEDLKIPEQCFDDGINRILDLQPSPLTVGLQYEGISARRRPLVRDRGSIQVYNLVRRV